MDAKNVKVVKLVSGEELIASCRVDSNLVTLDDTFILIVQSGGQLGMVEWAPYVTPEKGFVIKYDHIVFMENPSRGLLNAYIGAVTGVQVSNQPIPELKPNLVLG